VTLNDTTTGDSLDDAIATINAATASSGIYAVKNPAGTGISFQSTNGFTLTDQVNAAAAGSGVFGTTGAVAITYYSDPPLSTSAAATLSVNSSITAGQLSAISSTSANGIADQLAQLATAQNSSLSNLSYTDYYASVASTIGNQAASAATTQQTQTQALTQAQNMRAQVSGVSLNDQAAKLLQFQEAYQASAQMISVINTTMQSLLQMMEQLQ
jgi:flagellar hook-associated protein 1 FlgK